MLHDALGGLCERFERGFVHDRTRRGLAGQIGRGCSGHGENCELAASEFHGCFTMLSAACASASSAALCMTGRGAVSPVHISNWRTACSMNMSRPGTTVLPCCLARLINSVSSGL